MYYTKCGTGVDEVTLFCNFCECKICNNYNEHRPNTNDEKEIISSYLKKGYRYITVVLFLMLHHNIEFSLCTLKR